MSSPATQPILYILYNAKASFLGKLHYGYRKLSAAADNSPCSACDLTHGGLRLDETEEWKQTKKQIPAVVKQLHQDELTPQISEFIKAQKLRYPTILGQNAVSDNADLKVLMTAEDLNRVSKSHQEFLSLLSERAKENGLPLSSSSTASQGESKPANL